MDTNTLATELLKEVKDQARRWFIAFCIMVGLEIATIIGFMWYISLPAEDTIVTQDNVGSDNNTMIGVGDNYGTSDSTDNKTNNEK